MDADDIDPLAGRVTILSNGKLWVSGFIAFQYGKLSRDCKPHGPIFISLEKHGIDPDSASENQRVSKGYPKGIHTLQEKEKETDKEKEKENTPQKSKPKARASTPEEAEFFACSIGCVPGQGEAFFWKMEGNGWSNGGRPVKDWQATVRAWKAAGYLPVPEVKAATRPHAANHEPADMSIENTMRAMGATEEDIQHRLEFVARNLQQKSA